MTQKKKIILAVIVLVVIAATIVLAVTLMNRGKNEVTTNKSNNTAQNEQQNALLGKTFTDEQAGVTVRIPKDWELAPKNPDNPNSLTKFRHTQSRANGELTAIRSNVSMDDVVRGYLEGAMDIDYKTNLVEHRTVSVNGKTGRLLVQDVPGPNNQTARICQYFFNKNGTYYILTYTMLSTEWEAQRAGVEASAASLTLK